MIGKPSNIVCGGALTATALDSDLAILVRESLVKLLPLLKPRLREIFRRAELHGESREAIADSLAISVDTVDFRLRAARTEVRLLLKRGALYHINQLRDPNS